jgi:ubiquinone/menaquinone biosynthesis C-methylase UbiE
MEAKQNYYIQQQLEYVTSAHTKRGWKRRYDFALQHVRKGDTVLDCGCGLGQGTLMLAERCGKAVGIDIDSNFIAYCREHGPGYEFLCLDVAHAIPFPDRHFDVVVAIELLEHLPSLHSLRKTLSSIKRILKPGGFFVASVPNRRGADGKTLLRSLKLSTLKVAGRFVKKQASWHEHFTLWTPQRCRVTLAPYFTSVSIFGQWVEGITNDADRAPYILIRART